MRGVRRMPLNGDMQRELKRIFQRHTRIGNNAVEVSARDLCDAVGIQGAATERSRCFVLGVAVLRAAMRPDCGDEVLTEGSDSGVTRVRFLLPRLSK